jgi:hypothetical protein
VSFEFEKDTQFPTPADSTAQPAEPDSSRQPWRKPTFEEVDYSVTANGVAGAFDGATYSV